MGYVNSKGSDKTVLIHKLIGVYTGHNCDKYLILVSWFILKCFYYIFKITMIVKLYL